jgi:rhodanese-related sulfurtransferase
MEFFRKLLGQDLPHIDIDSYKAEHFQRKNHVLIDVRTAGEYKGGHIQGAKNIPLDTLTQQLQQIPTDELVVLVCQSGNRSANACRQLLDAGYTNVVNLNGGTLRWRMTGNPVK